MKQQLAKYMQMKKYIIIPSLLFAFKEQRVINASKSVTNKSKKFSFTYYNNNEKMTNMRYTFALSMQHYLIENSGVTVKKWSIDYV